MQGKTLSQDFFCRRNVHQIKFEMLHHCSLLKYNYFFKEKWTFPGQKLSVSLFSVFIRKEGKQTLKI